MDYVHASIIDERAVDPLAAQGALDRLRRRTHEAAGCAAGAAAAGVLLTALGEVTLGAPALAGAMAGVIVALFARGDRHALVARLVGQRSAYHIPEVAQAAARLDTPAARRDLSRSLVRLVLEAEGLAPRGAMACPLPDRVARHADDLLGVAYLLARRGVQIHPATIALLSRLLSSPLRSPLFNPNLPEQHLRVALQRIRCAID